MSTDFITQSRPGIKPGDGSSVFGGRPTFGLRRVRGAGNEVIELYEFLPMEQAEARRERHERRGGAISVEPIDEVFDRLSDVHLRDGKWEDWAAVKIAALSGARLHSVLSVIREVLGDADIDHKPVTSTKGGEVFVSERLGVKLALAFGGVKDLRRIDRMRGLVQGVSRMSTEECYYWYAKTRSPSSPNGVKALRTLLTDHIE